MSIHTITETFDPEKDALDFDRPLLRSANGIEFLPPPRLKGYCPAFIAQALGYAAPTARPFRQLVGIFHGPAGITVFDAERRIESGAEEPHASRRLAVLSAWAQSTPLNEALRGEDIGDGEITSHRCSVITVDLSNGNLWVLPYETAEAAIHANGDAVESDDVTEEQAVDLFYSWLSGEID